MYNLSSRYAHFFFLRARHVFLDICGRNAGRAWRLANLQPGFLYRGSLVNAFYFVAPPLGDAPQVLNARKGMSDVAYATALEEATHIIKTAYWYVPTWPISRKEKEEPRHQCVGEVFCSLANG